MDSAGISSQFSPSLSSPHEIHRKEQSYYPSFGEKIRQQKPERWIYVVSKICLIALCCLSVIGLIPLAVHIFQKIALKYRIKRFLPNPPSIAQEEAKVGRYYESHLLMTKSVDESLDWKKKLIQSAEKSIEWSANYAAGETFRELLRLIEKGLEEKRGLQAHLIVNPDFLKEEDREYLKKIQTTYKGRFEFLIHYPQVHLEPFLHTEENHTKMLIVDEKYFVMGGTSPTPQFSSEWKKEQEGMETSKSLTSKKKRFSLDSLMDDTSRDCDLVGEGERSAHVMRRQFFSLFQLCEMHVRNRPAPSRWRAIAGSQGVCQSFDMAKKIPGKVTMNARMKVLVGGPEHGRSNPITRQYLTRIQKAAMGKTKKERTITLANMEFYPIHEIRRALLSTRKKQQKKPVTISLIVPGGDDLSSLGRCVMVWHSRGFYGLANHVHEYQVKKELYHKKIALFGTTHAIIGSYNLGKKSARYDQEIVCVIKSPEMVQKIQSVLEEDIRRSRDVRQRIVHGPARLVHKIISNSLSMFESFV